MNDAQREGQYLLNDRSRDFFSLRDVVSVEFFFVLFLFAGFIDGLIWFETPPVVLLFMGLTVISSAVVLWKRRTIRTDQLILSILWLTFVAYALTSLLWVPAENYAGEKTVRLFITTLSLLVPAVVISSKPERRSRFVLAVLLFSVFTGLLMIWYVVESRSFSNMQAFGSSYQLNSRILGFGFLICTYLYIFERRKYRIRAGLGAGFFGFLLLGAGGRAPLVAVVFTVPIFVLVYFLQLDGHGRRKKHAKLVALATIVAGTLAYALTLLGIGLRTLERLVISISSGTIIEQRLMYYPTAVETWLENPFLGIGFGGWPAVWEANNDHPHNLVLEILSELGLIGFVLFAATIGYALAKIRPVVRLVETPLAVLFIGLFVYGLLITFVSGDINSDRFLLAIVGVLIAVNDTPKED